MQATDHITIAIFPFEDLSSQKEVVYWNLYLENYRRLISKGNDFTWQEAIDWIWKINPYRYKSNLNDFFSPYYQRAIQQTARTCTKATGTNNTNQIGNWTVDRFLKPLK